MNDDKSTKTRAIWALTPGGARLAQKIARRLPETDLFLSEGCGSRDSGAVVFSGLADAIAERFGDYTGHIFIMSTGIVVRMLAPLIRHKTMDPAVVAADEAGRHVISLLSGHIGGANRLAEKIAALIGARPVITTATDLNQVPAIDVLARERHLTIENPSAIKHVSMALLNQERIYLHDPNHLIQDALAGKVLASGEKTGKPDRPGVFVDDIVVDLPPRTLLLRPATLVAGIGCNRHTPMAELHDLLLKTLQVHHLAPGSLACLASVDIKQDEKGLLELGLALNLPVIFFSRDELGRVKNIQNPSAMVEKHLGVKSVCEAAAILAAGNGKLAVPKQTTPNVTVAVARKVFPSSE